MFSTEEGESVGRDQLAVGQTGQEQEVDDLGDAVA